MKSSLQQIHITRITAMGRANQLQLNIVYVLQQHRRWWNQQQRKYKRYNVRDDGDHVSDDDRFQTDNVN